MKFARSFLILCYGLFTISAQALLFREFISAFEGNEISVGIFFASWFLWVGLGALIVSRVKPVGDILLKHIEFFFLAYLPAFILELILIIQARQIAGLDYYTLMPVRAIVLLSIVVNAPVSLLTGLLFPTACRWVRQDRDLPVSSVYILEAAGSFIGGLATTLLLDSGAGSARIFFIIAFIASSAAAVAGLSAGRQRDPSISQRTAMIKSLILALVPLCILLSLFAGVDNALMRYARIVKWTRLLPSRSLKGSFRTAQAEYLYGIYNDQWLAVREGGVCETLPDESSAGRVAAIGLCQNPEAERILVIGSGLGLCGRFLHLPGIKEVTWAHSDSEYIDRIADYIPEQYAIADQRLHRIADDVRPFLETKKQYFDIVVINLPVATSSVQNRYFTIEFYNLIQQSLRSGGVLQVRIAGGENIMGTELVTIGASTKLTLEKAFSNLVLTPGETTWFLASDSDKLTGDPLTLRDRFAQIKGAEQIFPPSALLSIYLPDRADKAFSAYAGADLPEKLLINSDTRPLTHLYGLLLAAKQSGAPITKFVKYLALAGPVTFFIPIAVLIILRLTYILRVKSNGKPSGFDSSFLIFSAGWVAIGIMIVMMHLYQARFGSLYLHIGIISSAFMIGLTAGAAAIRYLLVRPGNAKTIRSRADSLMLVVAGAHILLLAAVAGWPHERWSHPVFATAFVLCGIGAGCYFPLAARQLSDSKFATGKAGGRLETADHLGACLGGLVTSLALLPVLGTTATTLVFITLILSNIPAAILRKIKSETVYSPALTHLRSRSVGYTLFGVSIAIIICSNLIVARAGPYLSRTLPEYSARALAGEANLVQASAFADDELGDINYYETREEGDTLNGYIFSSADLAPKVRGFGGKINLGIYTDPSGKLIDFHIIKSNETPAYLDLLKDWLEKLKNRRIFNPHPFEDVQAVSGATVSSQAVISALEKSGKNFAGRVLGLPLQQEPKEKTPPVHSILDTRGIYLIGALLLTLLVIFLGGFWSRLAVLCVNVVIGGVILNVQYSSEQIATLLSLHSPGIGLLGAFLLVAGVPLIALMFGNIYCGYICPFGAAQELIGHFVPKKIKPAISKETMQKARFIKYIVLFVLIAVFFVSRNRTTLAADPLIAIFSGRVKYLLITITAVADVGSLFYTRFWCRYLCPVGAFLSLINNAVIFKRFLPTKKFANCEFGLTAKDKMDCIYCDKCRFDKPVVLEKPPARRGLAVPAFAARSFVPIVLAVALIVSVISISRCWEVIGAGGEEYSAWLATGGKPRDIDKQLIRTMIRQGKLSDREAEFYKKVE